MIEFENKIHDLIVNSRIGDAITLIGKWANDNNLNDLKDGILNIQQRYNKLDMKYNLGLIKFDDYTIDMNQIVSGILDLASKLRDQEININLGAGEHQITKILMLTSNPAGTAILNLNEEHSAIVSKLQSVQNNFSIIKKDAVTISLFKENIEEIKPYILHFSGHGHEDGLMVQNDDFNGAVKIPSSGLRALFSDLKRQNIIVKSVILNACYTIEQSEAIAQFVDYVIGTTIAVGDRIAKNFSSGFYFKIAQNGLDFENAFRSGVVQAEMSGAKKSDFIMFKKGKILEI
jgi:hypothetical protein